MRRSAIASIIEVLMTEGGLAGEGLTSRGEAIRLPLRNAEPQAIH